MTRYECEVCGGDVNCNSGYSLSDGRNGCWTCRLKDQHNNYIIWEKEEIARIKKEKINNRFEILDL